MVAICDEAIVGWKILDEALPHVVKIVEGSLQLRDDFIIDNDSDAGGKIVSWIDEIRDDM